LLAGIHYNENADREVLYEVHDDGETQVKLWVEYAKWMTGREKAKLVRAKPTRGE
jgi:hypothetical protein